MANTGNNRVRVGGSGFTIFTFGGQPITFCQQVSYTSPQPVGAGASAIQPMDEPYPIEIITPIAAGMGQIVLNMFELFGSGGSASKAWDRLGANIGTLNSPFGSATETNASTQLNGLGNTNSGPHPNPFHGAVDIVDIFIRQASLDPSKMQVVKYIRPLPLPGGKTSQPYTEEYHGCIITNVVDNETIEVGTLEVIKQVTIAFRYLTRNTNRSAAFALRDKAL